MGLYLSKPNLMKISDQQELKMFKFAHSQIQGWRQKQDDHLLICPNFDNDNSLFGIFEVHGSISFGLYLKQNFIQTLLGNIEYKNGNFDIALVSTYETIDKYLMTDEGQKILKQLDPEETIGSYGGCTALVVLVTKEDIYVGNIGIARCVVQYEGRHKAMSTDHYPQNDQEKQRIIQAGGEIWEGRINAHFPISRAIGDYEYKNNAFLDFNKQLIISQPEVKWLDIEGCDMLLMGSHGFWQTWTNGGITDVIMERVQGGKPILKIIEDIIDSSVANTVDSEYGLDNISCVLILFNKKQEPQQ